MRSILNYFSVPNEVLGTAWTLGGFECALRPRQITDGTGCRKSRHDVHLARRWQLAVGIWNCGCACGSEMAAIKESYRSPLNPISCHGTRDLEIEQVEAENSEGTRLQILILG